MFSVILFTAALDAEYALTYGQRVCPAWLAARHPG
jgi:hypothetical protein